MKLIKPTQHHIYTLMSWFNNDKDIVLWGGPSFAIPFTPASFSQSLKLTELDSFALVANDETLIGFGQFYLRSGKSHLSRLIINPEKRGQGLSSILIFGLIDKAHPKLGTQSSSLFVYEDNIAAINAYQKLGFKFTPYSIDTTGINNCNSLTMKDCLYMVKS